MQTKYSLILPKATYLILKGKGPILDQDPLHYTIWTQAFEKMKIHEKMTSLDAYIIKKSQVRNTQVYFLPKETKQALENGKLFLTRSMNSNRDSFSCFISPSPSPSSCSDSSSHLLTCQQKSRQDQDVISFFLNKSWMKSIHDHDSDLNQENSSSPSCSSSQEGYCLEMLIFFGQQIEEKDFLLPSQEWKDQQVQIIGSLKESLAIQSIKDFFQAQVVFIGGPKGPNLYALLQKDMIPLLILPSQTAMKRKSKIPGQTNLKRKVNFDQILCQEGIPKSIVRIQNMLAKPKLTAGVLSVIAWLSSTLYFESRDPSPPFPYLYPLKRRLAFFWIGDTKIGKSLFAQNLMPQIQDETSQVKSMIYYSGEVNLIGGIETCPSILTVIDDLTVFDERIVNGLKTMINTPEIGNCSLKVMYGFSKLVPSSYLFLMNEGSFKTLRAHPLFSQHAQWFEENTIIYPFGNTWIKQDASVYYDHEKIYETKCKACQQTEFKGESQDPSFEQDHSSFKSCPCPCPCPCPCTCSKLYLDETKYQEGIVKIIQTIDQTCHKTPYLETLRQKATQSQKEFKIYMKTLYTMIRKEQYPYETSPLPSPDQSEQSPSFSPLLYQFDDNDNDNDEILDQESFQSQSKTQDSETYSCMEL